MADEADRAQIVNEFIDAAAIKAAQTTLEGKGSDLCIDCDSPIPAMRKKLMPCAIRCIACQEEYEKQ